MQFQIRTFRFSRVVIRIVSKNKKAREVFPGPVVNPAIRYTRIKPELQQAREGRVVPVIVKRTESKLFFITLPYVISL